MLLLLAYSGTKMIVFGGYDEFAQVAIDTLYILDVPTMTWSQGAKYPPRLGMVCSVSGDYFIVWGGMDMKNTCVARSDARKSNVLIVYYHPLYRFFSSFPYICPL